MKEGLRRSVVWLGFSYLPEYAIHRHSPGVSHQTGRLVVPFGPGGESDLIGRALSSVAMEYLGQPLLIQLKPGGLGIIGTELVAKAAPDGYTLLSAGDGWSTSLPAIEAGPKARTTWRRSAGLPTMPPSCAPTRTPLSKPSRR